MIQPISFNVLDAAGFASGASDAYDSATHESSLAHALIIERPHVREVQFRGTKNPLDWFTDAKIKFVEYPKGSGLYVHSGFNESMLSVREPLMQDLRERAKSDPKPVMIGGHSKGGGEGRQLIYGLTDEECAAIGFASSYTYGEPRSLSRAAAIAYDRRFRAVTIRVVHGEDCVTRMPFLMGRYRHAGKEVFLSSFGGYVLNPSLPFKIVSGAYGITKAWDAQHELGMFTEPLKDHFIANYISALTPFCTQIHRTTTVSYQPPP